MYFAEIPHRNEVLGWNVMLIEEDVYEKIVRKEITKEFNVIHFFGQRSFKTAETPYVVIKLIEDMMISKKEKKI